MCNRCTGVWIWLPYRANMTKQCDELAHKKTWPNCHLPRDVQVGFGPIWFVSTSNPWTGSCSDNIEICLCRWQATGSDMPLTIAPAMCMWSLRQFESCCKGRRVQHPWFDQPVKQPGLVKSKGLWQCTTLRRLCWQANGKHKKERIKLHWRMNCRVKTFLRRSFLRPPASCQWMCLAPAWGRRSPRSCPVAPFSIENATENA